MKNILKYLSVLIAGLIVGSMINYAHAGASTYTSGYEVMLINRATPLASEPAGSASLYLVRAKKMRLTICTCTDATCATRGGNLTGGTMQCWYGSPKLGWVINPDLALSVGAPAQACRTWADMESPAGNTGGKMFCSAVSVTTASGTHLEAHLEGIND